MPFEQILMPQYRDADPDGLIGLKGAMHSFQDIHTWFMHSIHKGNDELPEQYGCAWVYTRCLVSLVRKVDYTEPMALQAWMEPYRQPVLVNVDMLLCQHGAVAAMGKIENCVFSLERQRPRRLSDIGFPSDIPEVIPNSIPDFTPLEKTAEGMTERYVRSVRYSDLDKSDHMTNLKYIDLFQDAYDKAFWKRFNANRMEICFLSQCREGERLSVMSREEEKAVYLTAVHADGRPAAVCLFGKRS